MCLNEIKLKSHPPSEVANVKNIEIGEVFIQVQKGIWYHQKQLKILG